MVHFHLAREVFLQPFILQDIILDKRYCLLEGNRHGRFAALFLVEPSLRPPVNAEFIGVYADNTGDVECLNVDVQVSKRIYQALLIFNRFLTYIIPPRIFFFSASPHEDRNR